MVVPVFLFRSFEQALNDLQISFEKEFLGDRPVVLLSFFDANDEKRAQLAFNQTVKQRIAC